MKKRQSNSKKRLFSASAGNTAAGNTARKQSFLRSKMGYVVSVCLVLLCLFLALANIVPDLTKFLAEYKNFTYVYQHLFTYLSLSGIILALAIGLLVIIRRHALHQEGYNQKIQENEKQYENLLMGSSVGFWDWNIVEDNIYASPFCKKIMGLKNEKYTDVDDFLEKLHPDDKERVVSSLERHLNEGTSFDGEFRLKNNEVDGYVWIHAHGVAFRDDRGRAVRMIGSITDISHLKKTEFALRSAQHEAEHVNESKSRFLAVISHELRTPLTGMMGMIDFLLMTDLDKEQKQYVETLRSSGHILVSVLNQILDFSKIEADSLHLDDVDFSLLEVIEEIIALFQHKAKESGNRLDFSIAENTPDTLQGDPLRLQQIMFNLLSNAIKFTKNGTVTLHVALVPASSADYIFRFDVIDTGIGIEPHQQDRLFRPYSQAQNSTSRQFGGTGLGLAICKKLVEAMEGEIGVFSSPGKGSRFWFTIKSKAEKANVNKNPSDQNRFKGMQNYDLSKNIIESIPEAGTRHILLAEDDDVTRNLLVGMLTRWGFLVEAVTNGREALDKIDTRNWDILLIDMQMPVMNGQDLVKKIRDRPDGLAKIPILALTGVSTSSIHSTWLEDGVNFILVKPVNWEKLKNAIAVSLTFKDRNLSQSSFMSLSFKTATKHMETTQGLRSQTHAKANQELQKSGKPLLKNKEDTESAATIAQNHDHLFDLSLLSSVQVTLDEAQWNNLLREFLEELDNRFEALLSAFEQTNHEDIRQISHALYGLCANFGAKSLSEKFKQIENFTFEEQSLEVLKRLLHQEIPSILEPTQTAIRAHKNPVSSHMENNGQ